MIGRILLITTIAFAVALAGTIIVRMAFGQEVDDDELHEDEVTEFAAENGASLVAFEVNSDGTITIVLDDGGEEAADIEEQENDII
jgi:hypothetical protein